MARILRSALTGAGVLLLSAGGVFAHARLVSSDPAAGAHLTAGPARVALTFSEPLTLAFSRLSLEEPGEAKGAAPIPLKAVKLAGPRTLAADLPAPLAPGAYALVWRAVSVDSHHTEGRVVFTVGRP
jgi:methionine-rich copper-binding protein CopC